ncbi:hypothetical protein CCHL11_09716 [Colletotrichum chlorophyti]|uniref:Uncharacterized protein n=1 Tax=Colletotrichum chlorophyti TaxID=708187 RepID=A0A1Q8RH88_9PEZI|nr:hypothetical protein CCHL11_09716 [Colletotrichum chlorophyti]
MASSPCSSSEPRDLLVYQAKLVARIPSFVSDTYRILLVEAIRSQVNEASTNCNLKWKVHADYHSKAEPPSHEVVALALCYKTGALEGEVRRVQEAFYADNPSIAHHLTDWTLDGLVDNHNRKVRAGDIANVPMASTESHQSCAFKNEDDDATPSLSGSQRPANEDSREEQEPYQESEDTPLLNKLAMTHIPRRSTKGKLPVYVRMPSPVYTHSEPPRPVDGTNTSACASNTAKDPINLVDVETAQETTLRLTADIKAQHARARDEISQSETLRAEIASLVEQQPIADGNVTEQGLRDLVLEGRRLDDRILKHHADAIKALFEIVRLQGEKDAAAMEGLDKRVKRVENVLAGIGNMERRERDKLREFAANRVRR